MRYVHEFIHKQQLTFIEVGSYDEPELIKTGVLPNRNLSLELDALPCLRFFPDVENLILKPGNICKDALSYLEGLPIRTLKLDYYSDRVDLYSINLASFPYLQLVFSRTQYNFSNIRNCKMLCTLVVQEWYDSDLYYLQDSSIHAVNIFSGKLKTLNGIQTITSLYSFQIAYQHQLSDIHNLKLCNELESLSIKTCNHVLIAQLPELPKLRYLHISGTQKVDSLSFLARYPVLEYLLLFDLQVIDGNLDALLQLRHSVIWPDRRHYSIKNTDLPKASHKFSSAVVPHEFEILPEA